MAKAIVLLSGGLDSQLAVKLMLEQGIEVECLTSVSVFHPHSDAPPAVRAAERLGVPVTVMQTDEAMIEMVRHPRHGLGKNMNPCIDCRIFLLRKARERLEAAGADFIVTGEVLGQRPMSQRRWSMDLIEREAGVKGLLLRPLCAKLMPPTLAEKKGLVDREKLLAIRGRSRHDQITWAAEHGVTDYPAPAGGCLLTEPNYARRLRELLDHSEPTLDDGGRMLDDIRLLAVGRHFRLDDRTKAIVGRDEKENGRIEELAQPGDMLLDAAEAAGPTTLVRGDLSEANLAAAARITLKYGKARDLPEAAVTVRKADSSAKELLLTAAPATDAELKQWIITREDHV